MPRFYVFPDQASAQACVDGVDARAREIYRIRGFTEDPATGGFLSKDAEGDDIPGAVTATFDVPRQRADGRWLVYHAENAPYAAVLINPANPAAGTVADYVAQDIALSVPIETDDASWWPVSEDAI